VQRQLDGLYGRVGDGPADVLGERQVSDADDRDAILDAAEEVRVDRRRHVRGAPTLPASPRPLQAGSPRNPGEIPSWQDSRAAPWRGLKLFWTSRASGRERN